MYRRLLAVAATATLAAVVLTGCRSDPSVAAYVDGTKITETRVDNMLADARQKAADDNAHASQAADTDMNAAPETVPSRSDVVAVLVAQQITRRTLAQRGLTGESLNSGQVAASRQVPPSSQYNAALTEVLSGVTALGDAAASDFQPSDDDLRITYNNAVAAGAVPANQFDAVKAQLLQVQGLAQDIAARDALTQQAAQARITVNPRYAPAQFTIDTLETSAGVSFVAVSVPFGKASTASPAVVDVKPSPVMLPAQPGQQ